MRRVKGGVDGIAEFWSRLAPRMDGAILYQVADIQGVRVALYLESAGTLEHAQGLANQSSPRTTKLYGPRADEVGLDGYERMGI
jgi:hypothetical protein